MVALLMTLTFGVFLHLVSFECFCHFDRGCKVESRRLQAGALSGLSLNRRLPVEAAHVST